MSASEQSGDLVWLRFSARTTSGQEIELRMEFGSCSRDGIIDLELVADMATDIIEQSECYEGTLIPGSVRQVFPKEIRATPPKAEVTKVVRVDPDTDYLEKEKHSGKHPWWWW